MKRTIMLALAAALIMLLAVPVQAGSNRNFVAHLNGGQEVPSVDTNATGLAKFQVSVDGESITYRLIVANIENVWAAHIHCAPAGANGPVVATLFSGAVLDRVNGVLAVGTITDDDIFACGSTVGELVESMQSGETYVNVHTTQNNSGEVRGQID